MVLLRVCGLKVVYILLGLVCILDFSFRFDALGFVYVGDV